MYERDDNWILFTGKYGDYYKKEKPKYDWEYDTNEELEDFDYKRRKNCYGRFI